MHTHHVAASWSQGHSHKGPTPSPVMKENKFESKEKLEQEQERRKTPDRFRAYVQYLSRILWARKPQSHWSRVGGHAGSVENEGKSHT
ncbi:Hypothetical protein SMAX5B_009133 [Scophthalmus maximus]|uniref:Uncharacterized protein n=1 Tax=Scophthalmus maximus TaxID=52904 RepID=A0A2U9CIC8_SCOMX|nr:Hypothetical protein SMAX5B_009133 [Scophthalmus maximus]